MFKGFGALDTRQANEKNMSKTMGPDVESKYAQVW
jgi:hypothetical protein